MINHNARHLLPSKSSVLYALQSHSNKWMQATEAQLIMIFQSPENTKDCFNHKELDIIMGVLGTSCNKSANKLKKSEEILKTLRGPCHNPSSLHELAGNVIKQRSFPKAALNAGYAGWLFGARLKEWQNASPIKGTIHVGEHTEHIQFFSHPEVHNNELLFKCVDGHHLFVNLRAAVCRDALKGIRRAAFEEVARKDHTQLNIAMVVDGIDKQSNAFAQTMFSEEVEEALRGRGHSTEAQFCRIIREWYKAEDDAGLSSLERHQYRMNLRDYLLDGFDPTLFPPPGMHIKGNDTTIIGTQKSRSAS